MAKLSDIINEVYKQLGFDITKASILHKNLEKYGDSIRFDQFYDEVVKAVAEEKESKSEFISNNHYTC